MRKEIESVRTIRYLARYFEENFVDKSNVDDKNLNALEYALEAFESLNKCVVSREENRDYEHLTNQITYEAFVKIFEEQDWIDCVVSVFEGR